MKKKVLGVKLSLKKITIVALDSEKGGRVIGGTGVNLCIETLDCPTARLCPTNGCPVETADGCAFTQTCQPTWQRYCSVQLCPTPTTIKNCPSFTQICPL
ncbi:class I lanthipeptide [Taibaiella koreensis]|uniref:class I lanthipeptide n=1 Tax=Taibaiella koreensis TaxID=1268548 RepID=UPI0013C2AC53|nr:class I lanthipeptide [Taibaiella koreensis]